MTNLMGKNIWISRKGRLSAEEDVILVREFINREHSETLHVLIGYTAKSTDETVVHKDVEGGSPPDTELTSDHGGKALPSAIANVLGIVEGVRDGAEIELEGGASHLGVEVVNFQSNVSIIPLRSIGGSISFFENMEGNVQFMALHARLILKLSAGANVGSSNNAVE